MVIRRGITAFAMAVSPFITDSDRQNAVFLTVDFYLNAIMQIIMTSDINMQN